MSTRTLKKFAIGWKKVYYNIGDERHEALVQLMIPAGARVVTPRSVYYSVLTRRKRRTDEALVLMLFQCDNYAVGPPLPTRTVGYAWKDKKFKYKVGKTVKPKMPLNTCGSTACASGIHFYFERDKAEAHQL